MDKRKFKKGQLFFHKETKEKIMFGNIQPDGRICCLDNKRNFIYLEEEVFLKDYISYASLEKEAREKRRYQTW